MKKSGSLRSGLLNDYQRNDCRETRSVFLPFSKGKKEEDPPTARQAQKALKNLLRKEKRTRRSEEENPFVFFIYVYTKMAVVIIKIPFSSFDIDICTYCYYIRVKIYIILSR